MNKKNVIEEKNDEFYTRYRDIENEVKYYQEHLKDKVVLCNCDDAEWSNFWKYFKENFERLSLKKLIGTYYDTEKTVYKFEYDGVNILKTPLKGNGDFRSPEAIEVLKEADIVVSNPPFSLFRDYLKQLMVHKKKFLFIGNTYTLIYKDTFRLLKDNQLWLGHHLGEFVFRVPDSSNKNNSFTGDDGNRYAKFGNILWYTNLETSKPYKNLMLYKTYTPEDYPKYDNYDAINVNRVAEIPMDYDGVMGVPVTFLCKYNPEQFEVVGNVGSYAPNGYSLCGAVYIYGKKKYPRILVKRKE